jgi:RPA family protein
VSISSIKHQIKVVQSSGHLLLYFMRKPISKVHVVGLVVSIDIKAKRIYYQIDDGTEIIRCVKYLNSDYRSFDTEIQLGDLVMVKGLIEMSETNSADYGFAIKIALIETILDPNMETYHSLKTLQVIQENINP